MQNASWGVRTLIACQLRLSTSTVALVRMLLIKCQRSDGVMEYWSVGRTYEQPPITPGLHDPSTPNLVLVFVLCWLVTRVLGFRPSIFGFVSAFRLRLSDFHLAASPGFA